MRYLSEYRARRAFAPTQPYPFSALVRGWLACNCHHCVLFCYQYFEQVDNRISGTSYPERLRERPYETAATPKALGRCQVRQSYTWKMRVREQDFDSCHVYDSKRLPARSFFIAYSCHPDTLIRDLSGCFV